MGLLYATSKNAIIKSVALFGRVAAVTFNVSVTTASSARGTKMFDDTINSTGDVPAAWYRDLSHVGYNLAGQRLQRNVGADALSKLLNDVDDRSSWRKLSDGLTGRDFKLSQSDIVLLRRMQAGRLLTDPLAHITGISQIMENVVSTTEPKRRFQPSKWEAKSVLRLVRALRQQPRRNVSTGENDIQHTRDIWLGVQHLVHNSSGSVRVPKPLPPGNHFSFNPPAEYVAYLGKSSDYAPKSLRQLHSYENFTRERFERCLDLYLCPRSNRVRVNMAPDEILPQLPSPKSLKPFPEILTQSYTISEKIMSMSVHSSGEWLACSTKTAKVFIFDIHTGCCLQKISFGIAPTAIRWHPVKPRILLLILGCCVLVTDAFSVFDASNVNFMETSELMSWIQLGVSTFIVRHTSIVKEIVWHEKGCYFATIFGTKSGVMIHNLDKQESQSPFVKHDAPILGTSFHPTKAFFFICSQKSVRMYNLKTQELEKKFSKGTAVNSCMCISSSGLSLFVGTRNGNLLWFDIGSSTHSKVISMRGAAIGSVICHEKYPLLATVAFDGDVNIFHISETSDFDSTTEPMIVPVNTIKSTRTEIVDCCRIQFHPCQPWLFLQRGKANIGLFSPM